MATGSRPGLGGDDLPNPPGIPIVAAGELLNDAIVDYLQQLAAEGVMVEGGADESPSEFRVVAN